MGELNLRLKLAGIDAMKESRSNYIIRKMRESREISPEEAKISKARNLYDRLDMNWSENDINFKEENLILKNNVKELQEQLQNAYIRIKELTNTKQLELDFGEFYKEKKWKIPNA